jgi:uncharacterized phage-associated protein
MILKPLPTEAHGMRESNFSARRALESILFVSSRLGNPDIHAVLKLRYFADKLHMSRYGFIASGDSYSAMKFGPVASETYNLLKAARGERNGWIDDSYPEIVSGNLVVNKDQVKPLRDANAALLAASDVECLEEAIETYGKMKFDERTRLSHDAAWAGAWAAAVERGSDAQEMPAPSIAATLSNADEVLAFMHE